MLRLLAQLLLVGAALSFAVRGGGRPTRPLFLVDLDRGSPGFKVRNAVGESP